MSQSGRTKLEVQLPTRVDFKTALRHHGYVKSTGEIDYLSLELADSSPACCSDGCLTEPDGICEHGFPSVLIAMGVI